MNLLKRLSLGATPGLKGGALALSGLLSTAAWAQGEASINSGDTAWILICAALVLLMTPGLAFFYGGMVRSKNVISTLMHSFIALAVISVVWVFFGYSLAFGTSQGGWIGGLNFAFLNGVTNQPNPEYAATIPHSLFMVFQGMFAIITPALITGAFAERIKFKTYLAFLVIWSLVVYSPVAHWVWGVGGFIRQMGALDFAGGAVVHLTAGMGALAAALVFGRRSDYGKADTSPHNIPFVLLGTALLWFGWFGFNGGSALAAGDLATNAFVTTHIAAAVCTLAWMFMDWMLKGKPSVTGACIGAVVGLIAITPACGFVTPQSAIWIGLIPGVLCNLVAHARAKSQLDDTLDVFACHGVAGILGALLTGFFASKAVNPAGADGGFDQFLIQFKSIAIVGVYAFVVSFVLFKVLDLVFGLRPSVEEETRGLDHSEHNEKAYQS